MIEANIEICACDACPGVSCNCGCQEAAMETACACGPTCACGVGCNCANCEGDAQ